MRAIVLDDHGDTDVLVICEIPDPEPTADEVLVDVTASALNRADLLQRMGLYPGPPMEHEVPGLELSGVVSAVGGRVTDWSVGDEVMAVVGGGAHAEQIVVHTDLLMPVPAPVPVEDAAAIPEVFATAYDALVTQGGLASGGVALVHAGASGVGTAAIQIAHAVGGRVVVTASAGKVEACRELGADVVVDYGAEDFVETALSFTDGIGADVVLDVVGGDYLDRNLLCTRRTGTIVQVGVMGGGAAEVSLGTLLQKRLRLVGTVLRSRPLAEKIAVAEVMRRCVVPRFDDGTLRPVIDSRYPLEQLAAAHDHMAANANVGKILIDV